MVVHTHDDEAKKNCRKNLKYVFFRKRVLNNIVITGSTECQYYKTRNRFPSNFFGYRGIFSGKSYFEWFGKIYQRGFSGKM